MPPASRARSAAKPRDRLEFRTGFGKSGPLLFSALAVDAPPRFLARTAPTGDEDTATGGDGAASAAERGRNRDWPPTTPKKPARTWSRRTRRALSPPMVSRVRPLPRAGPPAAQVDGFTLKTPLPFAETRPPGHAGPIMDAVLLPRRTLRRDVAPNLKRRAAMRIAISKRMRIQLQRLVTGRNPRSVEAAWPKGSWRKEISEARELRPRDDLHPVKMQP